MGLQIKIQGATPTSGRSLCSTCKHASAIKGQNCEERIICNSENIWAATNGLVTMKVAMCGSYHPSNMPWLHEMEQMAWIVEARKRGPTGFQQPFEEPMEIRITPPSGGGKDIGATPTQAPMG
jgi:hypothetical protein